MVGAFLVDLASQPFLGLPLVVFEEKQNEANIFFGGKYCLYIYKYICIYIYIYSEKDVVEVCVFQSLSFVLFLKFLCFHEQKPVAFTSVLPFFVGIDSRNKKKQRRNAVRSSVEPKARFAFLMCSTKGPGKGWGGGRKRKKYT